MIKTTKKRRRSADMEAEMIQAAERIVGEEGLSALTARRLAGDVGVAVGTIYNVFENLDALVAVVNARTLGDLAAALSGVRAHAGATRDVLLGFADRYIEFVRGNPRRWMAVFEAEIGEAHQSQPNQAAIDRLFGFLEDAIGASDERIDAAMAHQSARGLWAAVHGLLMLSAGNRLPIIRLENVRPTIDHLVTCHLLGLERLIESQDRSAPLPLR
jgi:AcrR family transcriptional regulator